ncbi:MAG: bifunctional 4-hydroxy-2-oxoglutarate aldolase/2-dehydro-3-deoxy-phosphogluconate aldolase [Halieaceae bacterium]|jgi:2-dehydro-3-deoxyphosphogluconate aldolase/(4S)-4-hydroxy-2-oxoglutarate aldolase|nr:bifunctional 4-hydroxy-2-oxoglutarate aldolase/2-dehydro-3-deoxy-phosphogluconate aldolase [Halieaceae bacterium]
MNDGVTLFSQAPVVPVISLRDAQDAVPLAEALVAGGLPVLEITLRTAAGLEAIRAVSEAVPAALVGAGTVCSVKDYDAAVDAGSRFIVSPGLTPSLLQRADGSEIPLVPGVATASELMIAREAGYRLVKFFPAEVAGGVDALRAFSGPFADMLFCPTGGVGLNNLAAYLALPAVVTVGGSWLTPADLLAEKNWDAIRELAREAAERVAVLRHAS